MIVQELKTVKIDFVFAEKENKSFARVVKEEATQKMVIWYTFSLYSSIVCVCVCVMLLNVVLSIGP